MNRHIIHRGRRVGGSSGGGRIEPGRGNSGLEIPARREALLEVDKPPVFAFDEGDDDYLNVGEGILL